MERAHAHGVVDDRIAIVVPRLRGVFHQWACPLTFICGMWLALAAPTAREALAVACFTVGIVGIFGTSALYHRIRWSERARRRMRQVDHSMIFIGMALTYTAVWLSALDGSFAAALLVAAWVGAAIGVLLKVRFIDAHDAVHSIIYAAFGFLGLLVVPELASSVGTTVAVLLLVGGICHLLGGIAFATGRPNPIPRFVGHHEVFHACTVIGTAVHLAAFAALVGM